MATINFQAAQGAQPTPTPPGGNPATTALLGTFDPLNGLTVQQMLGMAAFLSQTTPLRVAATIVNNTVGTNNRDGQILFSLTHYPDLSQFPSLANFSNRALPALAQGQPPNQFELDKNGVHISTQGKTPEQLDAEITATLLCYKNLWNNKCHIESSDPNDPALARTFELATAMGLEIDHTQAYLAWCNANGIQPAAAGTPVLAAATTPPATTQPVIPPATPGPNPTWPAAAAATTTVPPVAPAAPTPAAAQPGPNPTWPTAASAATSPLVQPAPVGPFPTWPAGAAPPSPAAAADELAAGTVQSDAAPKPVETAFERDARLLAEAMNDSANGAGHNGAGGNGANGSDFANQIVQTYKEVLQNTPTSDAEALRAFIQEWSAFGLDNPVWEEHDHPLVPTSKNDPARSDFLAVPDPSSGKLIVLPGVWNLKNPTALISDGGRSGKKAIGSAFELAAGNLAIVTAAVAERSGREYNITSKGQVHLPGLGLI